MRRFQLIKFNRVVQIGWPCLVSLLLLLGSCSLIPAKPEIIAVDGGSTGVRGIVLKQDRTQAAGAFIYAYRSARHGLRGPADFGVRVDRQGDYFLDLVEGEYHLVARLRGSGADAGPPRPGDAWSIYQNNPILIKPNQVAEIDFILQAGSVPHQIKQGSLTSGDTGFSGQLVDADGKPFAGAFILAYRTVDFRRMPDFTSTPADAEGRVSLYVPEPGEYCLAARTKTRGQPRTGEPYGLLGREKQACRQVAAGEIIDIGSIVLTPYR